MNSAKIIVRAYFLFLFVLVFYFGFPDSFVLWALVVEGVGPTLRTLSGFAIAESARGLNALDFLVNDLQFVYGMAVSDCYAFASEISLMLCSVLLLFRGGTKSQPRAWVPTILWVLLLSEALLLLSPYQGFGPIFFGFFTVNRGLFFIKAITGFFFMLVLLNAFFLPRDERGVQTEIGFLLILFAWGLFCLHSSNDIFVLYLFFELLSFIVCLLIMLLATVEDRVTAALKYFILNGVASLLLCCSAALLYCLCGSLRYNTVALFMSYATFADTRGALWSVLCVYAVCGVCFAFFGKLGTFPFSIWLIDVYTVVPVVLLGFLLVPLKFTVFVVFAKLSWALFLHYGAVWQTASLVVGTASLLYGCLGALKQLQVKRFLAFTTVNQTGYLLVGLGTGTLDATAGVLLYAGVYCLTSALLILVFQRLKRGSATGILYFQDLSNLFTQQKGTSVTLAVIMFSFAGVPPLAGFYTKYFLLVELFKHGFYTVTCVTLLTSLLSTFYYIRFVKILFSKPVSSLATGAQHSYRSPNAFHYIEGALVATILLFPVCYEYLFALCSYCSHTFLCDTTGLRFFGYTS